MTERMKDPKLFVLKPKTIGDKQAEDLKKQLNGNPASQRIKRPPAI